jgi:uncharacterized protein with von Willebrand factor type A (vWA) domain
MVSRDTVIVIASDGLDVGEPALVREAMAHLHRRRRHRLAQPASPIDGYAPTALGMRTAMPYLTTLATVQKASDLGRSHESSG